MLMAIRVLLLGLLLTVISLPHLRGQSNDHIQESRYKPFRVLIISPDTARIDKELTVYVESIENRFKGSYYSMLRVFELLRSTENGEVEEKQRAAAAIQRARWFEVDVVRFRYYHMIAAEAFVSLNDRFQKYPWEDSESLECQVVNKSDLETEDFVQLTRNYDFDYVIYFGDIVAKKYVDTFFMDMTTYLFSRADSKVIMKRRQSTKADPVLCRMDRQDLLECLITRVTSEAISDLFEILDERQKR